ncbi:MAG: hypothetical protein FLDDKLPJ_03636 [Phycisphaerae bacterium]|nr:hypothetical protein [Phycisphaerae bacterium]
MTPDQSEDMLRQRVEALSNPTVETLLSQMVAFYVEQRAEGPDIDADGDMLLYQWGVYDWGKGERFELSIVRQFILPEEDEPYQLHLTMVFPATPELRAIPSGNQWCTAPSDVARFMEFIRSSTALKHLHDQVPRDLSIHYEPC